MLEHDRLTWWLQVGTISPSLSLLHFAFQSRSSIHIPIFLTLFGGLCKMETGLPLLNCLLQHTLRSLCSPSDSSPSSKWVYAVFWRILPRNYPPPRWEFGGTALDRSKGNKRNWILVWEDGFCDFNECESARTGYFNGGFGADIFFKMSHEVYSYGEGLVGKVAVDNNHKWVFRDTPNETESSYISSWNVSVEPRPKAWEYQFNSGIQTIVVIAVREGIVQLGSLNKIPEDLNLVMSIQRKFSYLQSVPGVFAIQRPYLPIQHPYILKPNIQMMESNETTVSSGVKRLLDETSNYASLKSINLGWNSPHSQNGTPWPPVWSPPSLPLLPNIPSVVASHNSITNLHGQRVKVEECGYHIPSDGDQNVTFNNIIELQDGVAARSGLESK